TAVAVHGDALPQLDRGRGDAARVPGRQRAHRRGRADGGAPPDAAAARGPVPPGVGAERARAPAAGDVPRGLIGLFGHVVKNMTEETCDRAIRAGLGRLVRGEAIEEAEAAAIFRELVAGTTDPAQVGGLLVGLAIRGETAQVIAGAARAMREAVVPVPLRRTGAIDTCGTGGSGVPRRNVS